MLSSRGIVCNAEGKEASFQSVGSETGKAANLFSASRRFRALASLAVARRGIVFLLLHLKSPARQ